MRPVSFLTTVAALTVATTSVAAPTVAAAQLFDTGNGAYTTTRTTMGVGQGIAVATTTQLTSFGFYLGASAGMTLKYVIFDGDNDTMLYSQTRTVTSSIARGTLTLTGPLDVRLVGGRTYYFGVLGDGAPFSASYFLSNTTNTSGLAFAGSNANYTNFAAPVFSNAGGATMAIQLNGTKGPITTAPEPGTWALLGTGLVTLAGVARRRTTRA